MNSKEYAVLYALMSGPNAEPRQRKSASFVQRKSALSAPNHPEEYNSCWQVASPVFYHKIKYWRSVQSDQEALRRLPREAERRRSATRSNEPGISSGQAARIVSAGAGDGPRKEEFACVVVPAMTQQSVTIVSIASDVPAYVTGTGNHLLYRIAHKAQSNHSTRKMRASTI